MIFFLCIHAHSSPFFPGMRQSAVEIDCEFLLCRMARTYCTYCTATEPRTHQASGNSYSMPHSLCTNQSAQECISRHANRIDNHKGKTEGFFLGAWDPFGSGTSWGLGVGRVVPHAKVSGSSGSIFPGGGAFRSIFFR